MIYLNNDHGMLENGLYLLKHSLMSWQIKNSMNDKPRNIDMKSLRTNIAKNSC